MFISSALKYMINLNNPSLKLLSLHIVTSYRGCHLGVCMCPRLPAVSNAVPLNSRDVTVSFMSCLAAGGDGRAWGRSWQWRRSKTFPLFAPHSLTHTGSPPHHLLARPNSSPPLSYTFPASPWLALLSCSLCRSKCPLSLASSSLIHPTGKGVTGVLT